MNLHSKRVLITRPLAQIGAFADALKSTGAIPIPFPVIQINPVEDSSALDRALHKLTCYDWLVLTSVNGVGAVWERLGALDVDEIPSGLRVAAIGPKTALALKARGVEPDFVPPQFVAESILPGLGDIKDCWVLLPRADLARPDLPRAIQQAGGIAHEIVAYRTLPAQPDQAAMQALREGVDIVTFTSSSTVRNFLALVEPAGFSGRALPGNPIIACIGPITAATARECGLPVDVVAEEYTVDGLVRALQVYALER